MLGFLYGICMDFMLLSAAFFLPASYDMHAAFTAVPRLFIMHTAFTCFCRVTLHNFNLHATYFIDIRVPLQSTLYAALQQFYTSVWSACCFYTITVPLHDRHDTSATSALYISCFTALPLHDLHDTSVTSAFYVCCFTALPLHAVHICSITSACYF
jgi:hypothetical protein